MIKDLLRKDCQVIPVEDMMVLDYGSYFEKLVAAIPRNMKNIVFDFSGMEFIDICEIDAILKVIKTLSPKGYSFGVLNPSKSVLKYLVLMDVTNKAELIFTKDNIKKKFNEKTKKI